MKDYNKIIGIDLAKEGSDKTVKTIVSVKSNKDRDSLSNKDKELLLENILKTYSKNEFLSILKESNWGMLGNDVLGVDLDCPDALGILVSCTDYSNCEKCWRKSVNKMGFKHFLFTDDEKLFLVNNNIQIHESVISCGEVDCILIKDTEIHRGILSLIGITEDELLRYTDDGFIDISKFAYKFCNGFSKEDNKFFIK